MTDQERLNGFIEAYNALRLHYGVYLEAVGLANTEGMLHISSLNVTLKLIPNWQPPQPPQATNGAGDTSIALDPTALVGSAQNGSESGRFDE